MKGDPEGIVIDIEQGTTKKAKERLGKSAMMTDDDDDDDDDDTADRK